MKYLLSILGLVAVVGFGYFVVSNSIGTVYGQSSGLLVNNTADVSASGAQVLALLNRLDNIKLDDTIFHDPAFTGLQDWTITIVPQQLGRSNPFLPVNGLDVKTTNTKTVPKISLPAKKK